MCNEGKRGTEARIQTVNLALCTGWRGEGKGPPTTCGLHTAPAILIGRASRLCPTATPCKLTSNPFIGRPLHLHYGGRILVVGEQGARLSLHSTHSITTGIVAGGSSSSLHFPHFPEKAAHHRDPPTNTGPLARSGSPPVPCWILATTCPSRRCSSAAALFLDPLLAVLGL
ncbi:unnamed protein product [Urochloa humidicola]